MSGTAHRSSWLKQKNKKHKSFQGTTTNAAAKRRDNGKVELRTGADSIKSTSIAAHLEGRKVRVLKKKKKKKTRHVSS
jgi:hypothetical protein